MRKTPALTATGTRLSARPCFFTGSRYMSSWTAPAGADLPTDDPANDQGKDDEGEKPAERP